MSLGILPTSKAMAMNLTMPFVGTGGTPPYTYSVLPGGIGGSIDSSGNYTSPAVIGVDTVQVTDSLAATATAQVFVGTPLELFCDILQNQLGLANGRVYIWKQKIFSPTDFGLWIAVSVVSVKPFGNSSEIDPNTGNEIQSVNIQAMLDINAISRDTSAQDRKEEIIAALNSVYSQQQQSQNSFRVFPLSKEFKDLSEIDGAAIPYRYNISCNIQYFVSKTHAADYFNTFPAATTDIQT